MSTGQKYHARKGHVDKNDLLEQGQLRDRGDPSIGLISVLYTLNIKACVSAAIDWKSVKNNSPENNKT